MTQTFLPEVLWAQRTNNIYIKFNLRDLSEPTLKVENNKVIFEGTSDNKNYACELELYDQVEPQTAEKRNTQRYLLLVVEKTNKDKEYWPKLTKNKLHFVKTDFSLWKDEDDNDNDLEEGMGGMGDFDFSSLGGMNGASMPNLGENDEDGESSEIEEKDAVEAEMQTSEKEKDVENK